MARIGSLFTGYGGLDAAALHLLGPDSSIAWRRSAASCPWSRPLWTVHDRCTIIRDLFGNHARL